MTPTNHNYRADIDGLRAVAVMAVVLHHLSHSWVPGGYVGVDVFFVISGYLITKITHQEIQEGTFTFAHFYERRIRRLLPALIAVLVFVLVVGWFSLLPSDYLAAFRAAAGTLLFSANIVFWRELAEGYFAADAKLNPLLHMWSLGVEEQFYLLFPAVLLLIHRFARCRLVLVLAIGLLISLGLSVVLTPIKSVAAYFLLPTRAWELLTGSLLAVVSLPQLRHRLSRELMAISAMLAIVAPIFLYSAATPFPGYAALLPVAGTAALIWLGGMEGATVVGRLLQLRPVVYIGLISYSLYLWHWPLIVFARFHNGLESIRNLIPLIFALSFITAALSHRFIEKPFRKNKTPAVSGLGLFVGASVLSMLLLAISALAIQSGGVPSRYSKDVANIDSVRRASIPYLPCQQQLLKGGLEVLCVIGDATVAPDTLLWGDSHMLAWGPGMDKALKELGRSAYFAPNSACPPILAVDQSTDPLCRSQNEWLIRSLLKEKSKTGMTVVMAGFWQKYFNDSNLSLSSDRFSGGNKAVATPLLHETIDLLGRNGFKVVVLGAVPAYRANVPYNVATGNLDKLRLRHADMQSGSEYGVLSSLAGYVDVAQWFCNPKCMVYDDGAVLYRDSNHLNPHGSTRFKEHLKMALSARTGSGAE